MPPGELEPPLSNLPLLCRPMSIKQLDLNTVTPSMALEFDSGVTLHGQIANRLEYQLAVKGDWIGVNTPTSTLRDDHGILGRLLRRLPTPSTEVALVAARQVVACGLLQLQFLDAVKLDSLTSFKRYAWRP